MLCDVTREEELQAVVGKTLAVYETR